MNDTVLVRPNRTPRARQELICLAFCGGGAGAYLPWAGQLPPGTGLGAVCYPGREGRFGEEPAANWDALAEDVVSVLEAETDRPYVLFGHSLGGLLAFDVAVRLERRGGALPSSLVISSAAAPSPGQSPQDMWPTTPWAGWSDTEIVTWMRAFGILPQYALDDPDLLDMAVELMRADIHARDSYVYEEGVTTGVPVQLLTGETDEVIPHAAGERWGELARGGFRHDVLPGAHFYTPEVWDTLPTRLTALGC
ncbi:thioesterase II family protein [Streptomyces sp. NBC_00859]|uniref:thioesterase II family protein n=1 Tax=Streptomyces sp. NBC_00859 TaxID=2903682 RepID=UPI00386B764C|nr:alpha/beta fold hydrolase [Streptomyces sp. NBC_00859]